MDRFKFLWIMSLEVINIFLMEYPSSQSVSPSTFFPFRVCMYMFACVNVRELIDSLIQQTFYSSLYTKIDPEPYSILCTVYNMFPMLYMFIPGCK